MDVGFRTESNRRVGSLHAGENAMCGRSCQRMACIMALNSSPSTVSCSRRGVCKLIQGGSLGIQELMSPLMGLGD
jgi:hypothetical protein